MPRTLRRTRILTDPELALYTQLWKHDGTLFNSDDAYGHQLTASGSIFYPKRGRYFDGTDDYIDVGNPAALQITDAISILMWAKRSVTTSTDTERTLLKDNAAAGGYGLSVRLNKIHFPLYIDGGWRFTDSGTWDDTNWHFLAGTYNSITRAYNIYKDNVNIDSETLAGLASYTIANVADNLRIGAAAGPINYFKGIVGEVYIYSRDLTASEVMSLCLNTKWRYA